MVASSLSTIIASESNPRSKFPRQLHDVRSLMRHPRASLLERPFIARGTGHSPPAVPRRTTVCNPNIYLCYGLVGLALGPYRLRYTAHALGPCARRPFSDRSQLKRSYCRARQHTSPARSSMVHPDTPRPRIPHDTPQMLWHLVQQVYNPVVPRRHPPIDQAVTRLLITEPLTFLRLPLCTRANMRIGYAC